MHDDLLSLAESVERVGKRIEASGDSLAGLQRDASDWSDALESRRDEIQGTLAPIGQTLQHLERLVSEPPERVDRIIDLLDPERVAEAAAQAERLEDLVRYLAEGSGLIRELSDAAAGATRRLEALRREHAELASPASKRNGRATGGP